MIDTLEYKGYVGEISLDAAAGILHGDVVNTRDVITFQATNVKDLAREFRESIEDYLAFCQERGESPDKPFSGKFLVRVSTDLHRELAIAAAREKKSLNRLVEERLEATTAMEPVAASVVGQSKLKHFPKKKKQRTTVVNVKNATRKKAHA